MHAGRQRAKRVLRKITQEEKGSTAAAPDSQHSRAIMITSAVAPKEASGYQRASADSFPLPPSEGVSTVPLLKIPVGPPQQHVMSTPRSLQATERALQDREDAALAAEQQAAAALFRAEEAAATAKATPRSTSLAAEAEKAAEIAQAELAKSNVAGRAVTASAGYFVVVTERPLGGFERDRYATEADARTVVGTLWGAWVLYHEQRGAYTEIDHGGWGFRHGAIRRHIAGAMKTAVSARMGHSMGSAYAANY